MRTKLSTFAGAICLCVTVADTGLRGPGKRTEARKNIQAFETTGVRSSSGRTRAAENRWASAHIVEAARMGERRVRQAEEEEGKQDTLR